MGNVAQMRETRNTNKIFVGNLKRKYCFRDTGLDGRIIRVKIDDKEIRVVLWCEEDESDSR
jgi:hypothetical protein